MKSNLSQPIQEFLASKNFKLADNDVFGFYGYFESWVHSSLPKDFEARFYKNKSVVEFITYGFDFDLEDELKDWNDDLTILSTFFAQFVS